MLFSPGMITYDSPFRTHESKEKSLHGKSFLVLFFCLVWRFYLFLNIYRKEKRRDDEKIICEEIKHEKATSVVCAVHFS